MFKNQRVLIYLVNRHGKRVNTTTQRVKNTNTEMEQHRTMSKSSTTKTRITPLWGRANGSKCTVGVQNWTYGSEAERSEIMINKKNNEIQINIEHVFEINNQLTIEEKRRSELSRYFLRQHLHASRSFVLLDLL